MTDKRVMGETLQELVNELSQAWSLIDELKEKLEKSPRTEVKCNFCGKDINKANVLVAGVGAFICDECVQLCGEIVKEKLEEQQRQHELEVENNETD